MKKCSKCSTTQPLEDFYKHSQKRSGYSEKCKECAKKDARENYAKNREYYSAYEKKRQQNPIRRQKKLEYQRVMRAKHPYKDKARHAVSNALRDGRLIRLPCEVCGEKAQAHHDDYSKPLDVRWLCFKHHREYHGQTVN